MFIFCGEKVYEWELGEETKEDAREHEFSASSNLFPGVECPKCDCHRDTANDKGVRDRENNSSMMNASAGVAQSLSHDLVALWVIGVGLERIRVAHVKLAQVLDYSI